MNLHQAINALNEARTEIERLRREANAERVRAETWKDAAAKAQLDRLLTEGEKNDDHFADAGKMMEVGDE